MHPLPEDVILFIHDNLETIDQLEILRVLGEDRQKEWDPAVLAGKVQAEPDDLLAHLSAMQGRGLIETTRRASGVSCRYGARTPELETMLGRLLQMYRERPVTTIRIVYDHARDARAPLRLGDGDGQSRPKN